MTLPANIGLAGTNTLAYFCQRRKKKFYNTDSRLIWGLKSLCEERNCMAFFATKSQSIQTSSQTVTQQQQRLRRRRRQQQQQQQQQPKPNCVRIRDPRRS
jgi:hypothetical protein